MKIVKEIDQNILNDEICLIPTMGALHEGHLSLIKKGKEFGVSTMVTIFINELQFDSKEDFSNYPSKIEDDIKTLGNLDIDYLFIPENNYIYPDSGYEKIDSGAIGKKFEGNSRPGHFNGMLTVVNRLFQLTLPKIAVFGKKDAQQLFLIKEMVNKKNYQIKIIEGLTVRDNLGLALSSRNLLLSKYGEEKARLINQILNHSKKEFCETKDLNIFKKLKSYYSDGDIEIDYLAIVDSETFGDPIEQTENYIIIIAAYIENIRLIDNIEFKLERV